LQFDEGHLPEFVVLDDKKDPHEWLTRALQTCFHYSRATHTALLRIHQPPAGYQYRIQWYVPDGGRALEKTSHPETAKAIRFAKTLLQAAKNKQLKEPADGLIAGVNEVLQAFVKEVAEHVAQRCNDDVGLEELDVSFMVYDEESSPAEEPAKLRVVGCSGKYCENLWGFGLEVGDGNAGRAFKNDVLRFYDREANDFKDQAYVTIPGVPPHEFLASIPLKIDAPARMSFGVLNIGTYSAQQALLFRTLKEKEEMEWLTKQTYAKVLAALLKLCKITLGEPSGPSPESRR